MNEKIVISEFHACFKDFKTDTLLIFIEHNKEGYD